MLEEKITEVLDKLLALGGELGTPAFEAVVRGVQLEGMFSLIGGVVALAACALFACLFAIALSRAYAAASGDEGSAVALVLVFGALTMVTGIAGPVMLLSSSSWIAAIDPVAEIARRIVTGG